MAAQPAYKPLDPTSFFPDGRSARPLVPGTVARGHLRTDYHLFTGVRPQAAGGLAIPVGLLGVGQTNPLSLLALAAAETSYTEPKDYVSDFPFPVTRDVLEQGFHRFMIYCVVCHDPLGTGEGKIVERGYTRPPSFHIERLRQAPVGHFFDVITNGYGSMPDYKQQVPPRDRWAIVAYIRALQLSQHFPERELTGAMRREWKEQSAETGGEETP
jgi:mono/diheme cytochrome c family protein